MKKKVSSQSLAYSIYLLDINFFVEQFTHDFNNQLKQMKNVVYNASDRITLPKKSPNLDQS